MSSLSRHFSIVSSCLAILAFPQHILAENDFSKLIRTGEKLFSEGLYSDAILLYSQALPSENEEERRLQISRKMALSYIKEGLPLKALSLLNSHPYRPIYDRYLVSLAYRQLGESGKALETLNLFPDSAPDMILLEKGYHAFQLGDFISARCFFSSIPKEKDAHYPLAQIYLAKMELMEGQYEKGINIIQPLLDQLPSCHPLQPSARYLQGWGYLLLQREEEALQCFEKIGDLSNPIQQGIIVSLLNQAAKSQLSNEERICSLSKAESYLSHLNQNSLLQADFYLIKARILNDPKAYLKAQTILDHIQQTADPEQKRWLELKRAEGAPSSSERSRLFENFGNNASYPPSWRGKGWFLKGLNEFREGPPHFEEAAQAFHQASEHFKNSDPKLFFECGKLEAIASVQEKHEEKIRKGWDITLNLMGYQPITALQQQEICYLAGWISLHLNDREIQEQARLLLEEGQKGPGASWKEKCLKLKGKLCQKMGLNSEADQLYAQFLESYPASPDLGEIWFWRGYLQQTEKKKEYFQNAFTLDPKSSFAPIAYFHYYTISEYMQGPRKAIKHLQSMPLLFPTHPLIITAHYLIGLNQIRDNWNPEGQMVRSKDYTAAIENFEWAESAFDHLFKNNLIAPDDLSYYVVIESRAKMERALANLAIAKMSKGGKREIYLDYSETVFKELAEELNTASSLMHQILVTSLTPYPPIWAEVHLNLSQIYREKEALDKGESVLNESLERYRKAQISQSYGLMKVWFEKGKIAQMKKEYEKAFGYFLEAEKGARKDSLNPDEKVDLWIQQSNCLKSLHQLEPAMLLLSQAINDDVISPLRIKAMVLRSEIYELQERPELARKQLEAAARNGGEWGLKAKEKLEKTYGK